MNCPNCGRPNRPNVNFCENCGANLAPLPPPPPPPRRAYAPVRPGCPAGAFTACLNWALGFLLVGAILAIVLVFLCVIDVPAAPYQTMLPNFAVNAWERLDTMQAQSCRRTGPEDGGQQAAPQPKAPQPEAPKEDQGDGGDKNGGDEGDECNRSKFVRETIPDHTVFAPGEKFTKSWTVRNEGTCTWTTDYTFRFTQGTRMGGAKSMNLPNNVFPGETITMEVDLTAPNAPGTYTGRWEFFDEKGDNFGWYSVVIDVGVPQEDVVCELGQFKCGNECCMHWQECVNQQCVGEQECFKEMTEEQCVAAGGTWVRMFDMKNTPPFCACEPLFGD